MSSPVAVLVGGAIVAVVCHGGGGGGGDERRCPSCGGWMSRGGGRVLKLS